MAFRLAATAAGGLRRRRCGSGGSHRLVSNGAPRLPSPRDMFDGCLLGATFVFSPMREPDGLNRLRLAPRTVEV